MRAGFADGRVLFYLSSEGAAQVHGPAPGLVGLQPQHTGGGELVVGAAAAGLLLHLHHVDGVPATLDLLRVSIPSLLYQYHA